jgi:hypothetical protein
VRVRVEITQLTDKSQEGEEVEKAEGWIVPKAAELRDLITSHGPEDQDQEGYEA